MLSCPSFANPEFRSPDAGLLYARVLEELGDLTLAEREYRLVAGYYPGAEARVRGAVPQARWIYLEPDIRRTAAE